MQSTISEPNHQTIIEAAEFHARVAANDVTMSEWRELETWIDRRLKHRTVFKLMEQISRSLRLLGSDTDKKALGEISPALLPVLQECEEVAGSTTSGKRPWSARQPHMAIAASIAAILLIPILYFFGSGKSPAPELLVYETAVGERKTVELADGSSVTLNAKSRISVAFSEQQRRISLRHGEVYLAVTPVAERPFELTVETHSISVIGTAFNVRYRNGPARVTVEEGRVRVVPTNEYDGLAPGNGLARPVELGTGQQFDLEPGALPTELADEELGKHSAWRDGWLHFDDHSLAAVVEELQLHVDKRIVITSRRAEQLKVGGSFNVDRFDSILVALASVLPVKITQDDERIVVAYDVDRG